MMHHGPESLIETGAFKDLYIVVNDCLGKCNMNSSNMPKGQLFSLKFDVQRECNQIKTMIVSTIGSELTLFKFGISYISYKLCQLQHTGASDTDNALICFEYALQDTSNVVSMKSQLFLSNGAYESYVNKPANRLECRNILDQLRHYL